MSAITQTTPARLSDYITKNPQDLANSYSQSSKMYETAAAASALVSIVIFGTLASMYLGLLGVISLSGSATLGILAGAGILGASSFKWLEWKSQATLNKDHLQLVADKLKTIGHWKEDNVKQFLSNHAIDINQYTEDQKNLLNAQRPTAPFRALLPLIAYYLVAEEEIKEATDLIACSQPLLDQTHKMEQNSNDPKTVDDIRQCNKSIDNMKRAKLGLNLQAAFYLQCLQNPTFQTMGLSELELTINIFQQKISSVKKTITHPSALPKNIRPLLFG